MHQFTLDDVNETYDPLKPNTTSCPLLPGQMVNVLDIPLEVVQPPQRVSSASGMASLLASPQMTYNPEDRYKKIHRKHPTKFPRHYRSSENLRHQAEVQTPPGIQAGPVQPSPDSLLKSDLLGEKSLKRIRGCPSLDQTVKSAIVIPQDAANQSSPETDTEMKLGQFRAFGPKPSFATDTRPSTRHGDFQDGAGAVGLGISFDNFPGGHFPSSTLLRSGSPVQTTKPGKPFTYTDSDGVNWPFPHPNPLQAHPNDTTSPSYRFPSPPASAPISPHSCPRQSDLMTSLNQKPCITLLLDDPSPSIFQVEDPLDKAGLQDLVSPSFSVTTASSMDQLMSPPLEPPCESGNIDKWSDLSSSAAAPTRPESISSNHSNHRLYTSGYKYSTNFEPYSRSGSRSNSVAGAPHSAIVKPTGPAASSGRPGSVPRAGGRFYELPGVHHHHHPTSKVSLDEPELGSSDFASSVFGALGCFAT